MPSYFGLLRYYITDRSAFPVFSAFLACLEKNLADNVSLLQIRERDLTTRELCRLCEWVLAKRDQLGSVSKILVNARLDVALACGADGVHLPSNSLPPLRCREIAPALLVGVSCHTAEEVIQAEQEAASFCVLSPIFTSPGKGVPLGLSALAQVASQVTLPVLALGGVTWHNAPACLKVGAAGVAGIRLFQERKGHALG